MSESLDKLCNNELEFFRGTAAKFAKDYPKIAGRLGVNPGATATGTKWIDDPHVERLIQAVAYLNARTRMKLDDSFPELVDAILGILYPHMLNPIPSMSIVGFKLGNESKDLMAGYTVDTDVILETERFNDCNCSFQPVFPVTLYPLEVEATRILAAPFSGPTSPCRSAAKSVFRIELCGTEKSAAEKGRKEQSLSFSSLRFFVSIPDFSRAAKLVELLHTQLLEITITNSQSNELVAVLSPDHLVAVGFSAQEAMLPMSPTTFSGYRLLTEYLVFPQKFLFFDIQGFSDEILKQVGNKWEISMLLREHDPQLAKDVQELQRPGVERGEPAVRLGCAPIVNMFRKTAAGIPLNHRSFEHRIVPDSRTDSVFEVYAIDNIELHQSDGSRRQYRPFYSVTHSSHDNFEGYWHAVRRPGPVEADRGNLNAPTEMYVSLIDHAFSPLQAATGTLFAELRCFNQDLPARMAAAKEISQIRLTSSTTAGALSDAEFLVLPTPAIRRHLGRQNLWPLVSQLSLNHLSLSSQNKGLDSLREILALNDPRESEESRMLIEGIASISCEKDVQRVEGAFVRGTRVHVLLEQDNFVGDSAFLFASVLNHFFSMYTSINSFVRLTANTNDREARGLEVWKWPVKLGNRHLI